MLGYIVPFHEFLLLLGRGFLLFSPSLFFSENIENFLKILFLKFLFPPAFLLTFFWTFSRKKKLKVIAIELVKLTITKLIFLSAHKITHEICIIICLSRTRLIKLILITLIFLFLTQTPFLVVLSSFFLVAQNLVSVIQL
jgi:hypothetical protein